jgi:cytochrome b involved in lipid metabolism
MKYPLAIVTGICITIISVIFVLGFLQKQQRESGIPSQSTLTSSDSTTPTTTQPTTKTFTAKEVAKHNSAPNCWLIISGAVYDVTKFLSQHPGGEAKILPYCGKEATKAFEAQDKSSGGGHTLTAQQMLQSYQIGVLSN